MGARGACAMSWYTHCRADRGVRGQLFLWLLLAAAGWWVLQPAVGAHGLRVHHLSIFGWAWPESMIRSDLVLVWLRSAALAGACCWAVHFAIPLSSAVCAVAFLLQSAVIAERSLYASHPPHFTAIGLVCFA